MRYKFFYLKKTKKGDIYGKKYLSLGDIPTDLIAPFVKANLVQRLYDHDGFLPKNEIVRKDGKDITKSNLVTLAKKGQSNLFEFTIKSIDELYDEIVGGSFSDAKKKDVQEKLIEYRVVSMQVKIEFDEIEREGGLLNSADWKLAYKGFAANQRWNTAKVFLANDPDIVALQEIENMEALKTFNKKYLYPKNLKEELGAEYDSLNKDFRGTYPFGMLIDSSDPRLIDVALLSRYPIISIRTHQFERFKNEKKKWEGIFSRDCLEVEIALEDRNGKPLLADYRGKILAYDEDDRILTPKNIGKTITIFVNHFKSRLGQSNDNPETSDAWKKREQQSKRVAEILKERFGDNFAGNFVVAGDLNDGPTSGALKPLLDTGVWNIVENTDEKWTHYYDKDDGVEQFDYLLLSNDLKQKNPTLKPQIERRGLAKNPKSKIDTIKNHDRFKNVEKTNTEASDHCAVFADIDI